MLKNKKVLITGANGFIGSHLVKTLSYEPFELYSLGRSRSSYDTVKSFVADITDYDGTRKIVQEIKPDYIFHFAGNNSRDNSQEARLMQTNHLGTKNLLNALSDIDYEKFLFLSTSLVYSNRNFPHFSESAAIQPETAYGKSKAEAEKVCLVHIADGKPIVIVRPFSVYGPGQENGDMFIPTLVRAMRTGGTFTICGGEQTRDYLHVHDLMDFFMCALASGVKGEILNCGTGYETSVRDVAEMVAGLLDERRGNICYQPFRHGDLPRHFADMSKVKTLLHWEARISLSEGLKETLHRKL